MDDIAQSQFKKLTKMSRDLRVILLTFFLIKIY
jgi:hypothetical protein